MNQPTKQCLIIKHLIILVILDFHIRLYKPYTIGKLVKKAFDQCNNKCGVPFEKNKFLTFLVCYI
jgi:hypothetical protein